MVPVGSWQLCLSQMKEPLDDVRAPQSKQTASSRAPPCIHEPGQSAPEPLPTLNLHWRQINGVARKLLRGCSITLSLASTSGAQMMVTYPLLLRLWWMRAGVKPPSCPNSPALWGGEKFQAPGYLSKQQGEDLDTICEKVSRELQ